MKFVDDSFTDISIYEYLRADKIVEIFWMNKVDLIYLHNYISSMLALPNKFRIEKYSDRSNDFKMKYHQIVFNRYKYYLFEQ